MNQNKPHYQVVAAVISHQGEILCMQRGKTRFDYTSFKYEFPGGKIEAGETGPEALARELREEMDLEVEVGEPVMTVEHEYPDFSITMQAFFCLTATRAFELREHVAFCWLPAHRLHELDWAAADVPIARKIEEK